jgi:hypothetical protein
VVSPGRSLPQITLNDLAKGGKWDHAWRAVDPAGNPWVTPVFYVADGDLRPRHRRPTALMTQQTDEFVGDERS